MSAIPDKHAEQPAPAAPPQLPAGAGRRRAVAHAALLVLFCAALFLPALGLPPLADPDEARAALIVQHMLRSGDWLVPRLAGELYVDKPAPFFWLAALGQLLTGDLELGGRLVSAVAATLAVLAAWSMARRAEGPVAGLVAGCVLATSVGFFVVGRLYRMDMAFVAFMWLAMWWFWRHERPEGPRPGDRWKRWVGFYAFCGAATLMKGPAGLGLPVLIVAAYLLLSGRRRRLLEVFHPLGIAAYLAVTAPWYVAISLSVQDYAYRFFVVQNLARYAGRTMESKDFPAVYYIAIILGGMMPWTVYLPGAILRDLPRRWRQRTDRPLVAFCWLATLIPTVFFMFSRTKLEVYIMPVVLPVAVLLALPLARWVTATGRDRLYKAGTAAMQLSVALLLVVLGVAEYTQHWLDAWIALPAAALVACVVLMGLAARRGRRGAFVAWAAAATCVTLWYGAVHTAPQGAAARSLRELGLTVRRRLPDDALLCYYGKRRYSFILYAGRTVAPQFDDHRDEDLGKLAEILRSGRKVFCLVEGDQALRKLEQACGRSLIVIGRRGAFLAASSTDGS